MERKTTKFEIALAVADFLSKTNRCRKAIDFYKEALVVLRRSTGNYESRLRIHLRLVKSYCYGIENFENALAHCKEALKISIDNGDREAEEISYLYMSGVYISFNKPAQCIYYQRKLLEIAKESGDKKAEATANTNIAYAYSCLGKDAKSIEYHNEALRLSREIGDREREGRTLSLLGSWFKKLAQLDKAISFLEMSLLIYRETGNRREEAEACREIGLTYFELGEYEKALDYHTKELKLLTKIGADIVQIGVCYNNIGTSHHSFGRYDEALELFLKTLEIMTKVGDKEKIGKAHHSLGLVFGDLGQYKDALEHFTKGLEYLKECGDLYGEGRGSASLGTLCSHIGQYNESIKHFNRALEIAQQTGNKRLESGAYCGLADAKCHMDPQSGQVKRYAEKSVKSAQESGDKKQLVQSYITLTSICTLNGQFDESLGYIKSAVEITKEIGFRGGEATCFCYLASIYEACGEFSKSEEHLQRALKITRETGSKSDQDDVLFSLGIRSAKRGEYGKAREYLLESIVCTEKCRERLEDKHKLSLDDKTFLNYKALYTLLIIHGNVSEALCTAERGRARALVDLMSRNYGINKRRAFLGEIYVAELTSLSIQSKSTIIFLAVANEHIFFWIVGEEGKITFKSSERDKSFTISFKLLIDQLTKALFDDGAGQCEDRSLCAYYKDKLSASKKKGKRKGKRPVEEEEDSQTEDRIKTQEQLLHLFYRQLVAPVVDHIQSQDIIIVPEGDMWMVPFHAFKDADGKFLSETYRIRVIPSLTALKLIQNSPDDYHKTTGALIVGDPEVHPATGLVPLPGARKEAQEIADLLGVTATVGRQATKDEVLRRIQEVSLIHIAAHGDAERGEIALSSNRCAPRAPRKEDFILTMEDVVKVGVRAKLVVLSCCHSGRGEIMKSEGVVGIARAFLASGARSVLVSLWVLDDKSTKEFMIRFYRHLVCDKLTASQAIHQSMKWMRQSTDFNSVADWAPFVLIGDDVKLSL